MINVCKILKIYIDITEQKFYNKYIVFLRGDSLKDFELENLLKEVKELLIEVKKEQKNVVEDIPVYYKTNADKLNKIIEFCKVADVVNRTSEKRISKIEKLLYDVFEK